MTTSENSSKYSKQKLFSAPWAGRPKAATPYPELRRAMEGRKGLPVPASTMQGREGVGQVLQSAAPAPVRDGAINDRVGDRSPPAAVFRNLP